MNYRCSSGTYRDKQAKGQETHLYIDTVTEGATSRVVRSKGIACDKTGKGMKLRRAGVAKESGSNRRGGEEVRGGSWQGSRSRATASSRRYSYKFAQSKRTLSSRCRCNTRDRCCRLALARSLPCRPLGQKPTSFLRSRLLRLLSHPQTFYCLRLAIELRWISATVSLFTFPARR